MSTITRRARKASLLLVVPALILALAACSPAGAGKGGESSGGDSGPKASSGQSSLMDWQLAYAKCMREQGVDMPDPTADGVMKSSMGGDQALMEAAGKTCQGKLGDPPPPSAAERAESDKKFQEWALKLAKCYRDEGYDVSDPVPGEMPQTPTDAPDSVVEKCGGGQMAKVSG